MAVVTGATRGIGAGLASHFASPGLAAGPVRPLAADGSARCRRPSPRPVDVTDAAAVDRLADEVVDRFGRIDVWVNNAGVLEPDRAAGRRRPAPPWSATWPPTSSGVMHGTAAFARHVRSRPGAGRSSTCRRARPPRRTAGWAAYCASKAAVEMVTEVVGLEEAGAGLRRLHRGPRRGRHRHAGADPVDPGVDASPASGASTGSTRKGCSSPRRGWRRASSSGASTRPPGCCPVPGQGSVRFRVPTAPLRRPGRGRTVSRGPPR